MRQWYELKFQSSFRTKVGSEFQEFFTSILERGYPLDFQKVKPYGNHGDRKCDGYQKTARRVYQVYAPEKMEVKRTTDKIEEDFFGAIQHWGDKMGRWAFVHNQWRGVPPDVLRKLLDIDGKNSTVVENWCEVELRNEFFQLKVEDQQALLGPSPTGQTITAIQMKDVVIVVNVVAHRAIVTYGEISALLYQRPAKFTPTETTNGPQFKIEVQGERSPRISNMQIFCFDMMLMQIVSARSMGPGFLIHDSHLFDPVDSRQVGTALQLGATLATENKFQYIVTLNSDKQIESPEGFTLSDYGMSVKLMDVTETGGLFGLRFG